uniref:Uncharacterized protein n=2 Tax=Cacopsylla melanoneura TaxID=428564 RepID=A0A8D8QT61_9HEMI
MLRVILLGLMMASVVDFSLAWTAEDATSMKKFTDLNLTEWPVCFVDKINNNCDKLKGAMAAIVSSKKPGSKNISTSCLCERTETDTTLGTDYQCSCSSKYQTGSGAKESYDEKVWTNMSGTHAQFQITLLK